MVPVVSTVTEQISGTETPSASMARRAPMIEDFVWSRSWVVSTSRASAPPEIRPSALTW